MARLGQDLKLLRKRQPTACAPNEAHKTLRDYKLSPDTLKSVPGEDIVRTAWRHAEHNRNICATISRFDLDIGSNILTPVVHALNDLNWLSGVSTLWEAKLTR